MKLKNCHNIDDFRGMAKRRIPSPLFHYIDGGADDESTLARNTKAFDDFDLIPNGLADVANIDLSTNILGQKVNSPLFLAPTGMSRLFHHDGERAASRAAEKFGQYYSLSTLSSVSIEEIGGLTESPKMFQIYIHKDRGLTNELIERCKKANFNSLCLTVDTIVAGNRERDLRTGMTMPPKFTPSSLLGFAMRPRWVYNYLTHESFKLANLEGKTEKGSKEAIPLVDYVNSQFDTNLCWDDAKKAIDEWGGPFAIKGIMSVEDAKRSVDIGASAIMISNHGGRQLDSSPAPFDLLSDIVEVVGDKIEIICDGGIRRGTHILKALALGADACSIGRPYLYGLAAGGQAGVEAVLAKFESELIRNMMLMGVNKLSQIDISKIRKR
ncbi:MAG TPA: alpha-hydroxy-acid oxidizing protein [Candidatus Thioglobus sp.]|jgi:L-lactate dehydrogenase (cytochrome)|nr:alpha-hydroxy-acid oxidizing protein [Candidatus Thioglobus sp.]HIL42860.1 alpha-hydroxy-acid oxidizing protein [Gammaproteobacteria bacterium]